MAAFPSLFVIFIIFIQISLVFFADGSDGFTFFKIIKITNNEGKAAIRGGYAQAINTISPVVIAITSYHLFARNVLHEVKGSEVLKFVMVVPKLETVVDYVSAILFFSAIAFILGYGITLSRQKKELKRAD